MTYLQMVNKVLVRLREEPVETVNQTTYSALVGELVNDAKRLVEDAWDWSALRTTLTVNTVDGTYNYSLTGSGNRIELLNVINDTSNFFMQYRDAYWFDKAFLVDEPASGSPTYYTFKGIDSNGDSTVDLSPIPDGVYSLKFKCVLRTPELEEDATEVYIPTLPIIHMATALAVAERGEAGGQSAAELLSIAKSILNDAIALDAGRHPEDLIYQAV